MPHLGVNPRNKNYQPLAQYMVTHWGSKSKALEVLRKTISEDDGSHRPSTRYQANLLAAIEREE